MHILISKSELQTELDTLLKECVPSHSRQDNEFNNNLIRNALHKLLGITCDDSDDPLITDYILLAHVSGLRLYLSVKENESVSLWLKDRTEYKIIDANVLMCSLEGWQQVQFLPVLISFQLTQYLKNAIKIKNYRDRDTDIGTIQQVLLSEIWITVNAFRIVNRHFTIHSQQPEGGLSDKVDIFVAEFLNDLYSLMAPSLAKEQPSFWDKIELLFPCGITNGHAIYLSFHCVKNICDLRIFNPGECSKNHEKIQSQDGSPPEVLPYYLGTVDLDNESQVTDLSKYLQKIYLHSYEPHSTKKKIITAVTSDVYNLDGRFKFKIDELTLGERLPGFPLQTRNNCVTYGFFAWWFCRNGRLSCLRDETFSSENSVFNRFIKQLLEYAVVRNMRVAISENTKYGQYLEEYCLNMKASQIANLARFYGNYPLLNTETFVIREDYFNTITKFFSASSSSEVQIQQFALHGTGGSGKTKLALQYFLGLTHLKENENGQMVPFYDNINKYKLRIWVNANNETVLKENLISIARDMASDKAFTLLPNANNDEILTILNRWLEEHPGWLLVLDNKNVDQAYQFLPKRGGDVLITSQYPNWQNGLFIPTMNNNNEKIIARQLLKNVVGRNDPRVSDRYLKDMDALLSDIGYLPLAIALLGIYIRSCGSVSICRQDYRTKKHLLLASDQLPQNDEHVSLLVTWLMSSSKLSDLAKHLLNNLIILNLDNLNDYFVRIAFLELSVCLTELQNCSLIECNPSNGQISIQPTLKDVIIFSLGSTEVSFVRFKIMKFIVPHLEDYYRRYARADQLRFASICLPHLLCIDANTDDSNLEIDVNIANKNQFKLKKIYLLEFIVRIYKLFDNADESIKYNMKAIKLINSMPTELSWKENWLFERFKILAELYCAKKNYQLAERTFRSILSNLSHSSTPQSYCETIIFLELTDMYIEQTKFDQAQCCLDQAQTNLIKIPDHLRQFITDKIKSLKTTLFFKTMNTLPNVTVMTSGQRHPGFTLLTLILPELEECYRANPDDPNACISLANNYFKSDKIKDAIPLYLKMLTVFPKDLALSIQLARCYQLINDYPKAEVLLRNLYSNNKSDCNINMELGLLLHRQYGRFDEAADYFNYVCEIADNTFQIAFNFVEKKTLPESLQPELTNQFEIFFPTKWLAFYMLILCYFSMHRQEDMDVVLKKFENDVALHASNLGYKMLFDIFTAIGRSEEANQYANKICCPHNITPESIVSENYQTQENEFDALMREVPYENHEDPVRSFNFNV